jgi:hypothetical protein
VQPALRAKVPSKGYIARPTDGFFPRNLISTSGRTIDNYECASTGCEGSTLSVPANRLLTIYPVPLPATMVTLPNKCPGPVSRGWPNQKYMANTTFISKATVDARVYRVILCNTLKGSSMTILCCHHRTRYGLPASTRRTCRLPSLRPAPHAHRTLQGRSWMPGLPFRLVSGSGCGLARVAVDLNSMYRNRLGKGYPHGFIQPLSRLPVRTSLRGYNINLSFDRFTLRLCLCYPNNHQSLFIETA